MSVKMQEKDEEWIDKFVDKLINLCHDTDLCENLEPYV